MPNPSPVPDVVFVAYPLPNGTQALMPHRMRPRSCVRLDGVEKVVYASRSEARRHCPKHELTYRCRQCGAWHRATKARSAKRRIAPPSAAWVLKRPAA